MGMELLNKNEYIEENIEEAREILRQNIPLETYLHDHGYYTNGYNGKIRCVSPNHPNDSSPSFFYSSDTGECNCFGCSLKGTVVELNRNIKQGEDESYSQVQSIIDLAREYKIRIPDLTTRSKKRKIVRKSTRKKGDDLKYNRVYVAKLVNYEEVIHRALLNNEIDVDEAMSYYKIIDDAWLGYSSFKEAYEELRGGNKGAN